MPSRGPRAGLAGLEVPFPPLDPGPPRVDFGTLPDTPGEDLLGVGADLRPGTLLAAYRRGIFPMGVGEHGAGPIGWWRPEERGVLLPGELRVSRSLRRSCRRYTVTVDRAFDAVVAACADPGRSGRWITDDVRRAYGVLHRLGWAHSVEVWAGGDHEGGPDASSELVGGLYGLQVGGLFAGESMFHRAVDASKVALVALDALVLTPSRPSALVDTQWLTPHLASLGVRGVPREEYAERLIGALQESPLDLTRTALLWPPTGSAEVEPPATADGGGEDR